MSQLLQAKREARRLFKLSQQQNFIINNLSEARKHIAFLKGYHSWHDYKENLKRQDFLQNVPAQVLGSAADIEFVKQQCEFTVYIKEDEVVPLSIKKSVHKPVVLGEVKKKRFNKKWLLDAYPATIVGTTGSGRTSMSLCYAYQYIANNEGVIYIDSRGEYSLYEKLYGQAKSMNRDDIYVVTYMTRSVHSIDPINTFIGNLDIFKLLFGEKLGSLMHEISLGAQSQNMLLDGSCLHAMLNLKNLSVWQQYNVFGNVASIAIHNYFKKELYIEDFDALSEEQLEDAYEIHSGLCAKAATCIRVIKEKETTGTFSKTPHIDAQEIFSQQKILLILLPAMEKEWSEFKILANITMLLLFNAAMTIEKKLNYTPVFLQNMILQDTNYCMENDVAHYIFKNLPQHTNFIFGFNDHDHRTNNQSYQYALSHSKTIIQMQLEGLEQLPLSIKGRIAENVSRNLEVLNKNNYTLKSLACGCAYVYMEKAQTILSDYALHFYNKSDNQYPSYSYKNNAQKIDMKEFSNIPNGYYFEEVKGLYINDLKVSPIKAVPHLPRINIKSTGSVEKYNLNNLLQKTLPVSGSKKHKEKL